MASRSLCFIGLLTTFEEWIAEGCNDTAVAKLAIACQSSVFRCHLNEAVVPRSHKIGAAIFRRAASCTGRLKPGMREPRLASRFE